MSWGTLPTDSLHEAGARIRYLLMYLGPDMVTPIWICPRWNRSEAISFRHCRTPGRNDQLVSPIMHFTCLSLHGTVQACLEGAPVKRTIHLDAFPSAITRSCSGRTFLQEVARCLQGHRSRAWGYPGFR